MHILSTLTVALLAATASYATPILNPSVQSKKISLDSSSLQYLDEDSMLHSDNYDMIISDFEPLPAKRLRFQNFEKFYDPQLLEELEYKMDETQFVKGNPVLAPKDLTETERQARLKLEDPIADSEPQRWKLQKGNSEYKEGYAVPHFDYDSYVIPEAERKPSRG